MLTAPDRGAPQDPDLNKASGNATGLGLAAVGSDIVLMGSIGAFAKEPNWYTGLLVAGAAALAAAAHCLEGEEECGRVVNAAGRLFFPDLYPGNGPIAAGKAPDGNHGAAMCAPDFNTGIADWYETVGPPGTTREMNHDDRFNHCMCELLDSNYARKTTGLTPAGCPSAEEKLRQDCLTNPFGPDPQQIPKPDAPVRPECLRGLSPVANIAPGRAASAARRTAGEVSCR